jgi:hypothetical protein
VELIVGDVLAGRPSIAIQWSDPSIPTEDAGWLRDWFDEEIGKGRRFERGETVQIGWTVTRLREMSTSRLIVEEPTFESFPIKWVDGVNSCLRHLRRQKDVVDSIEPPPKPAFPSILQAAQVCGRLGSTPAVILERGEARENFSGWYITCDDDADAHEPTDLRLDSLYSVAVKCPHIIPFLAMPPGHAGRVSPTTFEIHSPEGPVRLRPKSFLDSLNRHRQRR